MPRRAIVGMLVAMATIESLSGVTQGYLNPILPALGPVFNIDDPTISGLFLISNVSFAILTPIISRLGDSYGYRRILRISTLITAAGAILMAVAPSMVTVTVGVVALTCVVGFIPLMMGILRVAAPTHTRSGVSTLIGVLMISIGTGGLLAGIVGVRHPELGFWVGVPFALAAVACTYVLPDVGTPTRQPLSVLPLVTSTLGLLGVVVALSMGPEWGWADPRTLVAGVLGVVSLAVWIRLDSRPADGAQRFLDLRMLQHRPIRAITAVTFLFGFSSICYFGTNGIFLSADPGEAGFGHALSPLAIAVIRSLTSLASFAASLMAPRLMTRISERAVLVLAGLMLTISFVVIAVAHASLMGYLVGFTFFNFAIGLYQAATRALSVEGVPVNQTSSAAGLNELALSVGIAVGAAVIRMLTSAYVTPTGRVALDGLLVIWITLAAGALAAMFLAMSYPRSAGELQETN